MGEVRSPRSDCVAVNKENRLQLHYLDKTKHFIRPIVRIVLFFRLKYS